MQAETHITYKCNNSCIFCSVKKRKHREPSFEEIKRNINIAKNFKKIIISGGEPTLRSDFLEILKYARKFYKCVLVETNGENSELILESIKRGYIDEIRLPFHAHTPNLYRKITKNKASFSKIINLITNLGKLKESYKFKIITNTVITKFNLPFLSRITNFIESKYPFIDIIQISYVRFYPFSEIKNVVVSLERTRKEIMKCIRVSNKIILENFPLCIINHSSAKNYHWDIKIIKNGAILDPLDKRVFLKECFSCKLKKECQGLHNFYFLYFKPSFIKPFKKVP